MHFIFKVISVWRVCNNCSVKSLHHLPHIHVRYQGFRASVDIDGVTLLASDYTCADYPATLEGAVPSGIAAARGR
jgi:hypothetical protein